MQRLLQNLRAVAEPTRLRILALCGHAELSVSELVLILAQSQPRVSRHLKLLVEAGLLERNQEGSRAFYRPAHSGDGAGFSSLLIDLIPETDETLTLDLERLAGIQSERVRQAEEYFRRNAHWEDLRGLYVDDEELDARLRQIIADRPVGELLDIGTGAGRVLRLAGPAVERAVGIDNCRDMLAVARANLDSDGLRNCQVRQADMYRLPFASDRFDMVSANMLIRYADDPGTVIAEGARVLKPGGRFMVVDFATHGLNELRGAHPHRWLGFSDREMAALLSGAGLEPGRPSYLAGDPLTVCIWVAEKPPTPANDAEPVREAGS